MALTPEQLRAAINGYRGGANLGTPALSIDPALALPTPAQSVPDMRLAPTAQVATQSIAPAVAPPPTVAPINANVSRPSSYRSGIQQAVEAYRGATNEAMAGTQALGASKAAEADNVALVASERVQAEQADTGPDRAVSNASKSRAEQVFGDYQKLNAEAEGTKITRDRRTDSQRVVDTIATAFSALADGLSGFSGRATDYMTDMSNSIQAQIQADVDDQRAALEDKRRAADAKLTEYGIARQAFGDDKADENLANELAVARRTRLYAAKLDEASASAKSTQERLAADMMSSKLKLDAAEKEIGVWQGLEQNRVSASRGPSMVISPELQYRIARDQQEDARDPTVIAQQAGAQLTGDLVVKNPKVATIHAKNAEKIQASIDAAKNAMATIDQALALRQENPVARSVPLTDANAQLGNLQGDLDIALKTIQELGVLAGPDMALIRGQTGDTTGLTSSNDVKLRQLRDNIGRKVGGAVSSRGFANPFGEEPAQQSQPASDGGSVRAKAAAKSIRDRQQGNAPSADQPVQDVKKKFSFVPGGQ